MTRWERLNRRMIQCTRCPRLRAHSQAVAQNKRRAYRQSSYWGKPVANFGDRQARLLIVGLAPAAHGANRTGRMFTGDRSGDWLFGALYRAGFANQPTATAVDDGLELIDCAITATCHCAPPGNKPSREEIDNCRDWLEQTAGLLEVRVVLALGRIAWQSVVHLSQRRGWLQRPLPAFAQGATVPMAGSRWLVGSYHPSQQNTFTGRLTEEMLDQVFARARELIAQSARG